MPQTVQVDSENYFEEVHDIFPIEEHDSIEGVYEGHRFSITYDPPQYEHELPYRGKYRLCVFAPEENPFDDTGGTVWYSERHTEPEGYHELRPLFMRARKIAVKIASNDKYHECPYCHFLANDDWRITRNISVFSRNALKRAIPLFGDKNTSETCAGITSLIPPKAEVYRHYDDTNPIFDINELENCNTLVLTQGYPEWRYKSQLNPYTYYELQSLLNTNPSVFDDDLDIETIQRVLDSLSPHNKNRPSERLKDEYRNPEVKQYSKETQ